MALIVTILYRRQTNDAVSGELDPRAITINVLFKINGAYFGAGREGGGGGDFAGSARFVLCIFVKFWNIEKRGWDGPQVKLGAF